MIERGYTYKRMSVDQQENIYYFGMPPLNRQINHRIIEEVMQLNQLQKSIGV